MDDLIMHRNYISFEEFWIPPDPNPASSFTVVEVDTVPAFEQVSLDFLFVTFLYLSLKESNAGEFMRLNPISDLRLFSGVIKAPDVPGG